MKNFLEMLLRLKEQLGVQADKDVATFLGMSPTALNQRKSRGAFPEKEVLVLKSLRPELALDVDYIFTGVRSTQYEALNMDSKKGNGVYELERLVGMYSLLSSEAQQAAFAMVQHLRWQEFENKQRGR